MSNIFDNSGVFDGLTATAELQLPERAGLEFNANYALTQDGVQPDINIALVIDRSGSTDDDTGLDLDGDGNTETFLEAQVIAAKVLLAELAQAGYDPDLVKVTLVDYAGSAESITVPLSDTTAITTRLDSLVSSGTTNYAAALEEVDSAFAADGATIDQANFTYFFSDGFPFPADQDFQTPLDELETNFDPIIKAVGLGPNSAEDALDIIDSTGTATIVNTEQDVIDLLTTPPALPEIESFDVFIDGELVDTLIVGADDRININPTGFSIQDLKIEDYDVDPNTQILDVQIVANLTNGDTLAVNGPVIILDGIVEGTAAGDLIDVDYEDDPEGDRVDAQDNIDLDATPDQLDDDVILGFGGDDTIISGEGSDDIDGGTGNDTIDLTETVSAADIAKGGDDRDTFTNVGDGDEVIGGEGGDDFDTLDLTGSGPVRIVYENNDPTTEAGRVFFFDGNGFGFDNVTGSMEFSEIEQVIPCFTPGTLIETPRGLRAVETLREGDKVLTRDNGAQEIRWTGHKSLARLDFIAAKHLRPVLISKGALGEGLPAQDMLVSPNHRVLLTGISVQLHFGEPEVLVAAKHLVGKPGIHRIDVPQTSYIHFMFDQHEVVRSDGAWTESFQPGAWSLSGIGTEQREEIFELFPELQDDKGLQDYDAARLTLKRHEAALV